MNSAVVFVFAFAITIVFLTGLADAASNFTIINASSCSDSEGNCQLSNVQTQDGITESQVGHASAVRFIETVNSNTSAINSPDFIDNVTVYIDRFESANPGGQTLTISIKRPSDNSATSCTLSSKTTNDSTYNGCDVTSFITGSSSPESDAEGLTISYRVQALGAANTFYLDHSYVNITYTDSSPPAVPLNSPSNNTWSNSSNVTFQFTPNDVTSGISSCGLVLNNTLNATNSSITKNVVNNITTPLNQGSYNWTANCTDDSANVNVGTNTSIRLIRVDTTVPNILLNSPANVTNSTQQLQSFNFTPTDNLASSLTCSLFVNGTDVNSTTAANNTPTVVTYGLPQGRHTWYVRCLDQATNVNVSETRNITVDLTNPSVSNVTYLPSSEANLDPNTTVNVTANVSDNIELSSVILQYRLQSDAAWSEANMTLQSGNLYLGRFNATYGNWSFRVFANDTANNQNISSMTNISVLTDTTWENSTVFPSVKAIVQTEDRFFSVGNLTVNNTGDFDLNFTVNSSQSWIDFNGTTGNSISFRVNKSYNYTILNVTANTTGFAVGEFNFNVTIFTYNLTPDVLNSQRLPGKVVIQNVAGPFFTVTITNFDATVAQGDTGVNLSATVKNDGTGDSTQTWLAWTLPSGWSNTSGVLNKSIGFLGVGTTVANDVTVAIGSSATTGSFTLIALAGSAENVSGNDTKTVTVNAAPAASSTTTATSSGGAGGGGSAAIGSAVEKILSGQEFLNTVDRFDLVRGSGNSFPVLVKNFFERTTLNNVTIKIEGILPQYLEIKPKIIGKIEYNQSKEFNVTITSPEYTTPGSQKLKVIITGKVIGPAINKDFVETRSLTLVVHELGKDEAKKSIELAADDLSKMANVGFPTSRIEKLLDEAETALDENDYEKAKELTEKIQELRRNAFESYSIIQEVRSNAKKYISITGAFLGVSRKLPQTEQIADLALAAFEREDFEAALERAKTAKLTLALEGGEFSLIFFLVDYWWAIILGLAVATVGGFFGYRSYVMFTISEKIINLEKEEESIANLIKQAQKQRFQDNTLSADKFEKLVKGYRHRLAKIAELRLKLRYRRVRLFNPQKLIEDLEKESKEIMSSLKKLQRDYFEKRVVSKFFYDEQVKIYHKRLSEIEGERLTLETQISEKDREVE